MSLPVSRPTPHPLAEGWRVPVPMPVHDKGKLAGKPVGWLNLNVTGKGGAKTNIADWRQHKAWLLGARTAYQSHRVPTDLGCIYVMFEFFFTTNAGQEPSNFEPTLKPIIDAFKPDENGWGVIPDDDQAHIIRGPEMLKGKPLGRKSPYAGLVVVYIYPMPIQNLQH